MIHPCFSLTREVQTEHRTQTALFASFKSCFSRTVLETGIYESWTRASRLFINVARLAPASPQRWRASDLNRQEQLFHMERELSILLMVLQVRWANTNPK